jgi:coenzyme F420-0:L-glutamate ligase/coenzyme F420-1:gamma-L-glutamate ligase
MLPPLAADEIAVVSHKVVSKAEGRVVDLAAVTPSDAARALGKDDPRLAQVILDESASIVAQRDGVVISETRHGFVCANAGVDASNVRSEQIVLLPVDPDASARRIRSRVKHLTGIDIYVVISDTFGRAWRLGQTDVAIGVAGMDPFLDYRGTLDTQGREMSATRIAVADELAGAAEMVMGKADKICAAIVRGAKVIPARGAATQIVRPPGEDLFR